MVQSPRLFSYTQPDPEANFMIPAFAAGEKVCFREYPCEVFEIDTPLDLDLARAHFARCHLRASIS